MISDISVLGKLYQWINKINVIGTIWKKKVLDPTSYLTYKLILEVSKFSII